MTTATTATTTTTRPTKADQLRAARLELLAASGYLAATDGLSAVVLADRHGKPCAYGFRGRSMRAAFRYRFPTPAAREDYVAEWLAAENAAIADRAARKAANRAPHTLKVGDVLYSSWGYEQTNVDFYEVIAVRGAAVDLIKLKQDRGGTAGGMQGTCSPIAGAHLGEPIKGKRPTGRNTVRIEDYITAAPWDGRPLHWSSYA